MELQRRKLKLKPQLKENFLALRLVNQKLLKKVKEMLALMHMQTMLLDLHQAKNLMLVLKIKMPRRLVLNQRKLLMRKNISLQE